MRPVLACLLLLLAGCAEPSRGGSETGSGMAAGSDGAAPETDRDGPWTLSFAPEPLVGLPGDEVAFEMTVRNDGPMPDLTILQPLSPFVRIEGANFVHAVNLVEKETRLRGKLVLGPEPNVTFQVVTRQGGEGPGASYRLKAPVRLAEGAGVEPVAARAAREVVDVPPKLSVEVEGRRLEVTYATAAVSVDRCDEDLMKMGDFTLVTTADGERRLVGFVMRDLNDACGPQPPSRPRVVAQTPDLPPGDVRVMAFVSTMCLCGETGYFLEETTVRVP